MLNTAFLEFILLVHHISMEGNHLLVLIVSQDIEDSLSGAEVAEVSCRVQAHVRGNDLVRHMAETRKTKVHPIGVDRMRVVCR